MNEYLKIILKESQKAISDNEVPVGALIIKDNKIISKAHNNRQRKYNVLGHAEINAIIKAEKKLKDWRLDDCIMYVTLEPCEMCKCIIRESRLKKVYYLLDGKQNTKNDNKFQKIDEQMFGNSEYKNKIENFFQNLRNKS